MIIAQLNPGACRTYLLASSRSGEALLVDPVLPRVDCYLEELERRGLSLRFVVDTHLHADHVSGGAALADRTGASWVVHRSAEVGFPALNVDDGDVLHVGELEVRVLHTPGHATEHIALLVAGHLFSGDFLLLGGRGAAPARGALHGAAAHYDALARLEALPGDVRVWPGHDYAGGQSSTLGLERRANPRLRCRSLIDYESLVAVEPDFEHPTIAARVNRLVARLVSAEALAASLGGAGAPVVIDVRERRECMEDPRFVPGSRLVPLGELERTLPALEARLRSPIVCVCLSGGRSALAACLLAAAGFEHPSVLEGGIRRWAELDLPLDRAA
jgi:glyoxylase-like metal-dependent hydrolase (beta-lactamase superfamily II)/rhodanese-related sulfurtransferase